MEENKKFELSDEELDQVVGGYGVGDTVTCSKNTIDYCPNCGRLLKNYEATITGVRGVLDGKTIPLLYGDFSHFLIGDRDHRSVKRLTELYARFGQVAYTVSQRVDAVLLDKRAIGGLKVG